MDTREKLLSNIEKATKKQAKARRAVEVAQDAVTAANWERHEAELALRRHDFPVTKDWA